VTSIAAALSLMACGPIEQSAEPAENSTPSATASARASSPEASAATTAPGPSAAAGGRTVIAATPPPAQTGRWSESVDHSPFTTGKPKIDALIRMLERHDTDGIIDAFEYTMQKCVELTSPPAVCPEGFAPGDDVPVYRSFDCGRELLAGRDAAKASLEAAWRDSRSSTFVVASIPTGQVRHDDGREKTLIYLNAGNEPSAYGFPEQWFATDEGTLVQGSVGACYSDVVGVGWAAERSLRLSTRGAPIVPPRATCETGEASLDAEVVRVEINGSLPIITARVIDAPGAPSGAVIAIPLLTDEYLVDEAGASPGSRGPVWGSGMRDFGDVSKGMRLRVSGYLHASCAIEAWSVELL
jgi:hypothetical protein